MLDEFSRQRRYLIVVGAILAAALIVALSITVRRVVREQATARNWLEHTHDVVSRLDAILDQLDGAESGERGFIVTGRDADLTRYDQAAAKVPGMLAELRVLTADNDRQQQRLVELGNVISNRLAALADVVRIRRQSGFDAASVAEAAAAGRQASERIHALVDEMRDEENRLLVIRRGNVAEIRSLLYQIVVGVVVLTGVLLAVIVSMLVWINRLQAGLVVVCAWTRQIRFGDRWIPVEQYLHERFGVRVSHGMSEAAYRRVLAQADLTPPGEQSGLPTGSDPAAPRED